MKINLEFKDLRDLLFQLPKFAALISSDRPYAERVAQALEPDPETLRITVTPEDGTPFTPNEKEALRRLLLEFVKDPEAFTQDPDTVAGRVVNGLKADGVIPEKAPWAAETRVVPSDGVIPEAARWAAEAQAETGTFAPGGSDDPEDAPEPVKKPKGKKKAAPEPTEAPEEAEESQPTENTTPPEKAVQKATDADVRAALNALIKKGRRDAVKKILKSFGAANFSGLSADHYNDAIDVAQAWIDMTDEEYEEAINS